MILMVSWPGHKTHRKTAAQGSSDKKTGTRVDAPRMARARREGEGCDLQIIFHK